MALQAPVSAPPPAIPAIPAAPLLEPDVAAGAFITAAETARPNDNAGSNVQGTSASQQGMQRRDAAAVSARSREEAAGGGGAEAQSGAPESAERRAAACTDRSAAAGCPAEAADPSDLMQPAGTESAGIDQGTAAGVPDSDIAGGESELRGGTGASATATGQQGREHPRPEHVKAEHPDVSTAMEVSNVQLGDPDESDTAGEATAQPVSAAEAAPRCPRRHDDVLPSLGADEPNVAAGIGARAAMDVPQSGGVDLEPHMHESDLADSPLHVKEGSSPPGGEDGHPHERAACAAEPAQAAHARAASSLLLNLPGKSGATSCMDEQQAGQPDGQLNSIQAPATTDLQVLNLCDPLPNKSKFDMLSDRLLG